MRTKLLAAVAAALVFGATQAEASATYALDWTGSLTECVAGSCYTFQNLSGELYLTLPSDQNGWYYDAGITVDIDAPKWLDWSASYTSDEAGQFAVLLRDGFLDEFGIDETFSSPIAGSIVIGVSNDTGAVIYRTGDAANGYTLNALLSVPESATPLLLLAGLGGLAGFKRSRRCSAAS